MLIHWFQHDHFEDMAYIKEWATAAGHETSVTRFDLNPHFPPLDTIDWLVIMGGKMGAYEDFMYTWLTEEKDYIRKAIDAGKVVIGICLGSQLIAAALGANVYKNQYPETGFFPVQFTSAAGKDPVFKYFPPELTVLHIHNDTFDLPKGATLMASSPATKNQAFRFGNTVFAFQFHFEVTSSCLNSFFEGSSSQTPVGKWVQEVPMILNSSSICTSNNLIFKQVLDSIALLK